MLRMKRPLFCTAALVAVVVQLLPARGLAQDAGGRFTMTPTDGGFVRLDTQSGAMSLCAGKDGEWSCRAMPDDQKALQDRIARLEDENRALKEENRRLEDVLGLNADKPKADGGPLDAPKDGGPPVPPPQKLPLPSEKDVDKAFDYVEGLLKKFRERLKKLEQDEKPKDGGVPL